MCVCVCVCVTTYHKSWASNVFGKIMGRILYRNTEICNTNMYWNTSRVEIEKNVLRLMRQTSEITATTGEFISVVS